MHGTGTVRHTQPAHKHRDNTEQDIRECSPSRPVLGTPGGGAAARQQSAANAHPAAQVRCDRMRHTGTAAACIAQDLKCGEGALGGVQGAACRHASSRPSHICEHSVSDVHQHGASVQGESSVGVGGGTWCACASASTVPVWRRRSFGWLTPYQSVSCGSSGYLPTAQALETHRREAGMRWLRRCPAGGACCLLAKIWLTQKSSSTSDAPSCTVHTSAMLWVTGGDGGNGGGVSEQHGRARESLHHTPAAAAPARPEP